MSFKALSFYRRKNNVFQAKEIKPLFRLLLVIVITMLLFSSLKATVYAANITYEGNVNYLDTVPSWFLQTSTQSLFPSMDNTALSSDNQVVVDYDPFGSGVTNPDFVFGGLGDLEDVTGNSVEMRDGKVNIDIFGGYSASGNAVSNAVTISGGTVTQFVYGGWSNGSGNSYSNKVAISGGTVGWNVFGGYSWTGNTADNTVTISNGTVSGYVDGGWSNGSGNSYSNKVAISGGTVGWSVSGGRSEYGNAMSNDIDISGGTVGESVFGGYSDYGNADSNIVTISNGTVDGSVFGGWSYDGNADSNIVTISGVDVGWNVFGGWSEYRDVTNNAVVISDGYVGQSVLGGESYDGAVTNNFVTISDGTVDSSVFGGYSESGVAAYNSVTISDGYVGQSVLGGESYYGAATNNSVTISGGTVGWNVYGGYSDQGDAINNTVTIMGSPTLTTAEILGGYSGASDAVTGNTLNFHSSNISAAGVGNFQYYNFYLPDGTAANDAMLTVTTSVDLIRATATVSLQGKTTLRVGDKVSLINSALEVSNYSATTSQASLGAFLTYDFDIYADTKDLWAELISVKTSPGNKALTNSRTAPLAFLNQGADLAASLEHLEISGDSNYTAFAIVGGGSSTYDTGSDVDVKGVSVLAGVTRDVAVKKNSLTMSAFIEAGWGSYDTDNSFGGTSLKGSGDTDYYGGGLYLRHNWVSGLYADASLRVGHMSTDFDSSDLGISGSSLHYDSGSTYYGAHAGLGYSWNLSGKTRLDVSGKYLWTRLDSDEITASSGDETRFDSANSHRLRAGFRFYHDYGNANAVTLYYGAAYEYEFDGDADGRLYGTYALDDSSLSGGSGIDELGVMFRPSRDNDRLTMQLGLQGYVGVREGFSGTLKLCYAF